MAVILYCTHCRTGYASAGERPRFCPECRRETAWTVLPPPRLLAKPEPPQERPAVLVLLIHKRTFRTAVVDLLEVERWLAEGYVIVVRDPFTMDAWHQWRACHPEAQ